MRQACDAAGALLIFDEIPTGLGRTGHMFACDPEGVTPDILVLGKALGGGVLPIAAVIARPALDVAGAYAIGHYTHEKNPVTARAALTTLQIIEDEGLAQRAGELGAKALERLNAMKDKHQIIGNVRGRGLLLGVELVTDRDTKTSATDAAEEIFYRALEAGLSFKVSMGECVDAHATADHCGGGFGSGAGDFGRGVLGKWRRGCAVNQVSCPRNSAGGRNTR